VVAEPSAAALIGSGRWQIARDPAVGHAFEDVAIALILGRTAAADCAAVAVTERDAPHRALPFLCQHLVLLVPESAIHSDLQTAWEALPEEAWRGHHLTWISGPSKTADIEQTLVYGAHGPLTLDVIAVSD
jgi:L-lactate dehydrogenase complex protein LldG